MSNKKLITDFYAAFARGNAEEILQYVTDDFIMHVPGKGLNAGEYWGKDGFKKFLGNISSYGGGKFSVSVPAVAVNDNVIYTREEITMNRKDDPSKSWTLRFIMEYKVKDDHISEAWIYQWIQMFTMHFGHQVLHLKHQQLLKIQSKKSIQINQKKKLLKTTIS